jgi:site-specific DNA recombinase
VNSKVCGRIYRCTVSFEHGTDRTGHITRKMEPVDEYVSAAVSAALSRPDLLDALRAEVAARQPAPRDSSEVVDLTARKNSLTRHYAQGAIGETQLVEGTSELNSGLDAIQREVLWGSRSVALSCLVVLEDPGAAFLAAPVETRREVLRALLWVEILPDKKPGGSFDPDTVRLHWNAGPQAVAQCHVPSRTDNKTHSETPRAPVFRGTCRAVCRRV